MDEQSQPSLDVPVKKGGLGCGTFMAFVLVLLILVAIGSNEAVGYYLKHCSGENLFDCLLDRVEEPEPQGAVTATGTYSYKDYSVVVTMNIPLEGGSVTGSMSGTCDGSVTGACSPFFVNIPASADYSGIVNKDSKTVPVSFTGRGAGLTHKDSMSLSY